MVEHPSATACKRGGRARAWPVICSLAQGAGMRQRMPRWMRAWCSLALIGVCLGLSKPAHAWLNLSVQADNVLIELSRDGSGVVAHEVLLRVRGGPLKQFVIKGVDPDAV